MKQIVFLALAASAMLMPGKLKAQLSTTVTEGQNAAFYSLNGTRVSKFGLSPDGRYWGINVSYQEGAPESGYIYDMVNDSLWETEVPAAFIVSPDWYAGGREIYKDGEVFSLETRSPQPENATYGVVSLWATSAGLDTLFSMSYEQPTNPADNEPIWVNYAYLMDGSTGKIREQVKLHWDMDPNSHKENTGHGERVDAASNDGSVLAGHSSDPNAVSNWQAVFWDLENDTSFAVGTLERYEDGSLNAINNDGSVMAGSASGKHVMVYYDRENLSFAVEDIPYAPGKGYAAINGISENGWVIMSQSIDYLGSGREPYMYNYQTKTLVPFYEYVEELYGLEVPVERFYPAFISDDARLIAGSYASSGAYVGAFIQFDENPIFAKARSFAVRQMSGTMTMELSWDEPLPSQYTLQGYDVYCDSIKINTELIPASATSYLYENVESGIHTYQIKAVYAEGESDYRNSGEVLVIGLDGCLPVQSMGNTVVYNRYAHVYWGVPSAQMASTASAPAWDGTLRAAKTAGSPAEGRAVQASHPQAKSYRNTNLDLREIIAFDRPYTWGGFIDGDRLYASNWNDKDLIVYNLADMSVAASRSFTGEVYNLLNIIKVDDYIYVAGEQDEVLVLDAETLSLSRTLNTDDTIVYICHVPELNGGANGGGFIMGDWKTLRFTDMRGNEIEAPVDIDITGLSISGMAYYDGMLYILSQSGENLAELYTVDFATGEYVDKKILAEDVRLEAIDPTYGFSAGGLNLSMMQDSAVVLLAMMQFQTTENQAAVFEVESAPGLLGYNLYRNGDKVNADGEYIQGLEYVDTLMEAGEYTYTVEPVNEDGCTGMLVPGVETTLSIAPIGECAAPSSLTAVESNHAVMVEWEYIAEDGPALVGFNVYRNGELVSEEILDFKYTENNVAVGDYTYVVEAYHNNSCATSDTVKISVTHEGILMPPSHIALSSESVGNEVYNVEAQWELPYYEQPLAIGYGNLPYSGTALSEYDTMHVAIGWDSTGLMAYRDLYLIGIEFFIGEGATGVEGEVYLNNALAITVPMTDRIREASWNTLMFNQYISMDQPMEVVVGYKVSYGEGAMAVAAFDMGPAVTGYGDLMSVDGQTWTMLSANGIDANWNINALVVKKRDLVQASKQYVATGVMPKMKVMSLSSVGLKEAQPFAEDQLKASSESVKLKGFNVYRNREKLNEEVLSAFSYVDRNVVAGEYDYSVSAVYESGEEESELYYIELKATGNEGCGEQDARVAVYPNPVSDKLHVESPSAAFEILSLSGKRMGRYEAGVHEIDVRAYASGLYLLRFETADGSVWMEKLVIE